MISASSSGVWPLPLKTLSASSLATFSRCPEQWRRRYIHGEKLAPGVSAVLGNAAHGSAEANYRQKAMTGIDLAMPDVEIAFAEAFDQEVERNGGAREIDWSMKMGREKMTLTPGKAKDRGLPLAREYRAVVAPRVQPIASEEWFDLEVPGVPVPLKGKIDLIEESAKTDIKFGNMAKQTIDIGWRMQGFIYMLVDRTTNRDGSTRLHGLGKMPFQWHSGSWGSERYGPKIWTPETAPELVLENSDQNMLIATSLVRTTVNAILAYWREFGPDEAWPGALQHSWACSFCGFQPTCHWWHGPQRDQLTLI